MSLSFVTVVFPIQLWHSAFTDDANLIQVEIPLLDFEGSWVRSVSAGGASLKAAVRNEEADPIAEMLQIDDVGRYRSTH